MKGKLKKTMTFLMAMGLCLYFTGCSAEQMAYLETAGERMEEFGCAAGEELRKWGNEAGQMLQELEVQELEEMLEVPETATEPPTQATEPSTEPAIQPTDAAELPLETNVIVTKPITYFELSQLNERGEKLYDAIYKAAMQCEKTATVYEIYQPDEIQKVLNAVRADHPELFWLESGFEYRTETMSYNEKTTVTLTGYGDWSERMLSKQTQEVEAVALGILREAMTYETDYERAVFVHDYLVNMTTYSFESDERYSIYGCLVDRACVCAGYAKTYQYLLQRLGISCGYTVGEANGGSHAWNFVELDGAYYWVDVTWDDPISETPELLHRYCFVTTEMLERTHTISDEENLFIPVCDTMDCNFYVQEDSYFTAYDDAVTAAIAAGKKELCFSNAAAYEETLADLIEEHNMWTYLPADRYSYICDDEHYVLKLDYK